MSALRDAIEGLYAAFARYPLRARIEGCPHCELGGNERSLHAAPLRRLGVSDFARYPFKAMTTFGDVDDFRHFFPRIAELVSTQGDVGACDLGLLAHKLDYAAWQRWPDPERSAVLAWLTALEDAYLEGEPCAVHANDLLDASLTLRGDVARFVERWPSARAPRAIEALADAVLVLATESNRGGTTHAAGLVSQRAALKAAFTDALDTPGAADALAMLAFPPFSD